MQRLSIEIELALERHQHRLRPLGQWLSGLGLALAMALAIALIAPVPLGFERYVITGDSMSGTYDRGSILWSKQTPVDDLKVGDVITFKPPPEHGDSLVTHRISAAEIIQGERVFQTAGDANETADPWQMTFNEPVQARAVAGIPYLGYVVAAFSIKWVRILLIGVPAALIAVFTVVNLWREASEAQPTDLGAGAVEG